MNPLSNLENNKSDRVVDFDWKTDPSVAACFVTTFFLVWLMQDKRL